MTDYTYGEAGGNLTLIHYPASSSLDVTFAYDALGRRTAMANNEAAQTYAYDDLGNLLSQSVAYTGLPAKTLSYTYHPNGTRNTFATPGGTQTYHYDGAGRMTSQVYGLGTAAWQYLDNGLLSKQTLPNGAYTDYAYNVANQLTGLANVAPDDSAISTYGTMAYAGTGDLSTVTSTIPGATSLAGVVDYAYDRKRELTEEDSTRAGGYDSLFTFDAAGNPTSFKGTAHTYNADNQLTGPESYVYDGNGNPSTWQGTALSWDPENRLLAYGNILTAGYRGDGLRAWKQTSSGRTYFLYDGINTVAELDGTGVLTAESVFGAAGLLSRGSVQYQFDPLGDAVHQLDSSGAVTSNRLFDAWGNELTSGTGPHGYRAQVGYYADAETGLVALAHRYYAPGVGRFDSRDPIGYDGGVNLFSYAAARPTSLVDRLGLTPGPVPGYCYEPWARIIKAKIHEAEESYQPPAVCRTPDLVSAIGILLGLLAGGGCVLRVGRILPLLGEAAAVLTSPEASFAMGLVGLSMAAVQQACAQRKSDYVISQLDYEEYGVASACGWVGPGGRPTHPEWGRLPITDPTIVPGR